MSTRRNRTALAGLFVLAPGLLLGACTGDGDADKPASTPSQTEPTSAPMDAAPGKLTGRLRPVARDEAVGDVAQVVDGWFEAAYLGDYPRDDFSAAWPGFSKGLAAQARREAALMSNAEQGAGLESVRATTRKVRVDLLSVKGKPVGATARFRLVLDSTRADGAGTETISGRLSLTPTRTGWQVFEYKVARR